MQKRSIIAAGAITLGLITAGTTGAVAGSLIGSKDIRDNSVRSVDVRDGNLRAKDLRPGVVAKFTKDSDTVFDDSDLQAQIDALQAEVDALKSEDESGVNTNWVANGTSTILDANTVRLQPVSSVEITNLDLPVQATKTIEFTYSLADGAAYSAGSPRVFVEINGEFFNTFDGDPTDAGTDNGDGTFTKTVVIPKNGRVGNAGVVADAGTGTVTVSNLVISGHSVKFTG